MMGDDEHLDQSAFLAAFVACALHPLEDADERAAIAEEYRDRGPAEVIYTYDDASFLLRIGGLQYAITVARMSEPRSEVRT